MEYVLRVLLSGILIVIISEVAKRQSLVAATIASLPWIAISSFLWLYHDTHSSEKISALSMNIFWMVIPSLSFFPLLSLLLKYQINFYASVLLAALMMGCCYFAMSKLVLFMR
jgi:hypothetical protein